MRRKEKRLVVSFSSATKAMEAEERFREKGILGRMIPLPGELSAECGLAWQAPLKEKERIEALSETGEIQTEAIEEVFFYILERKEEKWKNESTQKE